MKRIMTHLICRQYKKDGIIRSYYREIEADRKIKRLEEENLVLKIEVKDLKKEISGLNEQYMESLKEKDAVQDAFDAQQDKIDHLEETLKLKGL